MSNAKISMDAIKAKLLEASQKSSNGGGNRSKGPSEVYPFWQIPEGQTATVRFLPDGNDDNVFFWQKKESIKLPFEGSVGGEYETNEQVEVTVPCVKMFGLPCPITAAISPWWDDEAKKPLARLYYRKQTFLYQGFVVTSPFEEELPENPIRKFSLNKSMHEIIEQSLLDMEESPVDFVAGRDFTIKKTKKGDWANYSTSAWSFRTRSLETNEALAIEQHGLRDLSKELGEIPDAEGLAMLKAMFEDSLAGKPFDNNAYGAKYRAYTKRYPNEQLAELRELVNGGRTTFSAPAAPAAAPAAPVAETAAAPAPAETAAAPAPAETAAAPAPAADGEKADALDILARIRSRSGNTGT